MSTPRRSDDRSRTVPVVVARRAARMVDAAGTVLQTALRPTRSVGFPYRKPSVPTGVEVPAEPSKLGADFDTEFARRPAANAARKVFVNGPLKLAMKVVADPEVTGTDRLADLAALDDPPALIFTPNHHSHLDTMLMMTVLPEPWRSTSVVAGAADYFFDTRVKGTLSALALNALPIDREVTGRRSSDLIRRVIEDGWSLVIYPEGGRSPDGWGQDFKGGAAYLSARTGAPVVPVFIDGTGAIFGKGMKRPKPGATKVRFGAPMLANEGESTRRFSARIEAAVTALGDEVLTDFWTARRRAHAGTNPRLSGPEFQGWRRQWALHDQRKLGAAGLRRRQRRRWPDLD